MNYYELDDLVLRIRPEGGLPELYAGTEQGWVPYDNIIKFIIWAVDIDEPEAMELMSAPEAPRELAYAM
jgi:hypothetical protein